MANRYSQLTQTPYVSTYTPAPVSQFAQIAKESRDRLEQTEMQNAQTRALGLRALGTASSPEERAMIGKIVNPAFEQIEGMAQGDDYRDQLLNAKTLGLETASKIETLTSAVSNRDAYKEEFLENNPDVDPDELEYRLSKGMPELRFDEETGYVSLDDPTWRERLASDVNLTEAVDAGLSGIKSQGIATQYSYDPERGMFVNQEGDEVRPERARRIASLALEGNREAQNYLNRREEFHTMRAQDAIEAGDDPVGGLISAYDEVDEGTANELRTQVDNMRRNGFSDPEIYGRLMKNNELNNALNFGEDKYAFSDISESARNPSSTFADTIGTGTSDDSLKTGQVANPYVAGMNDTYRFSSQLSTGAGDVEMTPGEFGGAQRFIDGRASNRGVTEASSIDERIQAIGDSGIRATMEQIKDLTPRQEGESKSDYLDRLERGYNNYVTSYKNTKGVARRVDDPENKIRDSYFGDPNDPSMGRAESMTYYRMSEDGYSEAMTINELAEDLGLEPKELANKFAIQGEFEESDGIASGGLYVTAQFDNRGLLGIGGERGTAHIKVAENSINDERQMAVRNEVAKLDLNPSLKEGRNFVASIRGELVQFKPVKEVSFQDSEGNPVSPDHPDAVPVTNIQLIGENGMTFDENSSGEERDVFNRLLTTGRITDNY